MTSSITISSTTSKEPRTMSLVETRHATRAPARLVERWEFRALFVLTYPLFLVVAVIGRLMPRRPRFMPTGVGARMSIFAEARASALTTLPFAFMG